MGPDKIEGAVNWYPGHMAKSLRQMTQELGKVDVVLMILDARIPASSINPDIMKLTENKKKVVLMTKKDLADPGKTDRWIRRFEENGMPAAAVDSRKQSEMTVVRRLVKEASKEKRERDLRRGIKNRPVRIMAAGIPNAGKSTILNTLSRKASLKTGNKPGVTRGEQWITPDKDIMLLDTPGLLWPKQDQGRGSMDLALTGSINDDILDLRSLSIYLIGFLMDAYPEALSLRYGDGMPDDPEEALREAGRRRGALSGDEVDMRAASALVINDFRSGRLGRITLEEPEDWT